MKVSHLVEKLGNLLVGKSGKWKVVKTVPRKVEMKVAMMGNW